MRCEGWRKYPALGLGGGTGRWEQCQNNAIVMLEVKQEEVEKLPACQMCHDEVKENGIEILSTEDLGQ